MRERATLSQRKKFHTLLLTALTLLLISSFLQAQRTDVVILENGDRVTGEIKKMERGKLEYRTDNISTIYIEWIKIDFISSKDQFDIELETGVRYIGSIEMTEEKRRLIVNAGDVRFTLDMISVVRIYPLEGSFWKRVKGYLDVLLSYQRANRKVEWKLGSEVSYRGKKWVTTLSGSSYYTQQEGGVPEGGVSTSRNDAAIMGQRILKNRWTAALMTTHEQNDELNLDYRALVGGAFGRFLVQNNSHILTIYGGLTGNREQYSDSDDIGYNAEGLLNVQYEAFRYDTPKLDFSTSLSVFPSLTTGGRVRTNFSARLSYEIFKDFYITLDGFYNYDNKPPGRDPVKHDYGIDAGITWSFK
jgi:hypothetical protein